MCDVPRCTQQTVKINKKNIPAKQSNSNVFRNFLRTSLEFIRIYKNIVRVHKTCSRIQKNLSISIRIIRDCALAAWQAQQPSRSHEPLENANPLEDPGFRGLQTSSSSVNSRTISTFEPTSYVNSRMISTAKPQHSVRA